MFHVLGGGGGGGLGVLGLRAPLHCCLGGGPAVPSLPLVVGAVARPEALHVLLGALLQAFPCSTPVLSHNWPQLL